MSRHNRLGTGTDHLGLAFTIEYPPDWLDRVKITRVRAGGRQSTMTLFRNPDGNLGSGARRGNVRLRVSCETAGLDVHLALTRAPDSVQKVAVEVMLPSGPGADPEPVTLTFYAFRSEAAGAK